MRFFSLYGTPCNFQSMQHMSTPILCLNSYVLIHIYETACVLHYTYEPLVCMKYISANQSTYSRGLLSYHHNKLIYRHVMAQLELRPTIVVHEV